MERLAQHSGLPNELTTPLAHQYAMYSPPVPWLAPIALYRVRLATASLLPVVGRLLVFFCARGLAGIHS